MTTTTRHPAVQPSKRPVIRRLSLLAVCAVAGVGFFTSAGTAAALEKPEQGGGTSHTPVIRTFEGPASSPAAGIDRTSAALGALAGIALAGAGVGVTLTVQRFRDHTAAHPA